MIAFYSDCPPKPEAAIMGGKACPAGALSCVDGENRAYNSMQEAWDACAVVGGCDFIIHHDIRYWLRRMSDPDSAGFKGYSYPCSKSSTSGIKHFGRSHFGHAIVIRNSQCYFLTLRD